MNKDNQTTKKSTEAKDAKDLSLPKTDTAKTQANKANSPSSQSSNPSKPVTKAPSTPLPHNPKAVKAKKPSRFKFWLWFILFVALFAGTGIGYLKYQEKLTFLWQGIASNEFVKHKDLQSKVTALEAQLVEHVAVVQALKAQQSEHAQERASNKLAIAQLSDDIARINALQLPPDNILLLVRNHLNIINQQLYFEYSKNHIDQQLLVAQKTLQELNDPRLAKILTDVIDFRKTISAQPKIDVAGLVQQLRVQIKELDDHEESLAVNHAGADQQKSLLERTKSKLSQLVQISKLDQSSASPLINHEARLQWLRLNLEALTLKLWSYDWQGVNAQAQSLRLWLKDNQPDLLPKLNPILSVLQTIQPQPLHNDLYKIIVSLDQTIQTGGQ